MSRRDWAGKFAHRNAWQEPSIRKHDDGTVRITSYLQLVKIPRVKTRDVWTHLYFEQMLHGHFDVTPGLGRAFDNSHLHRGHGGNRVELMHARIREQRLDKEMEVMP